MPWLSVAAIRILPARRWTIQPAVPIPLLLGNGPLPGGHNSTAFGWQTKATEKRATAFGERTTASGANSTAFGQLAVASGQNSTAFGNEAVANNYGSTAFGNRTEALGAYSTAFGNSTVAAGMNTVAFGTDNVAGAVLDDNGAYTNIIYKTNPKNNRVIKDTNGNPIELSRERWMPAAIWPIRTAMAVRNLSPTPFPAGNPQLCAASGRRWQYLYP